MACSPYHRHNRRSYLLVKVNLLRKTALQAVGLSVRDALKIAHEKALVKHFFQFFFDFFKKIFPEQTFDFGGIQALYCIYNLQMGAVLS